jgi:hypothetical protein
VTHTKPRRTEESQAVRHHEHYGGEERDTYRAVPDSEGREKEALDYLRNSQNTGNWILLINDTDNAVNKTLKAL